MVTEAHEENPEVLPEAENVAQSFAAAATAQRFRCGHPDSPPFSYLDGTEYDEGRLCSICEFFEGTQSPPVEPFDFEAFVKANEERKNSYRLQVEREIAENQRLREAQEEEYARQYQEDARKEDRPEEDQ